MHIPLRDKDAADELHKLIFNHHWYVPPNQTEAYPHKKEVEHVASILPASEVKSVVDVGCFEGYTTVGLAKHYPYVLGLDARPQSLAKAFLRSLYESVPISLSVWNAEVDPVPECDLLFHAGLFYHLTNPMQHLRNLAGRSRYLYLETHVAPIPGIPSKGSQVSLSAIEEYQGYRGVWWRESGWKDPLSGLHPRSFWLDRTELQRLVAECGFTLMEQVYFDEMHGCGPRGGWLLKYDK